MLGYLQIAVILATLSTITNAGYIDLNGHGGGQSGYESAGDYSGGQDDYGASSVGHSADYNDDSKYSFNYAVHDPHTGDIKQHTEERNGHVVKGSYSLKEADGSTRVVEYSADKHNGFNAKVHKIAGDNNQEHYNY